MRLPVVGFLLIFILTAVQTLAQELYRIQNRWKEDEFIHVERPKPYAGPIEPGWHSAQWAIEPVDGTGFYQIHNLWRGKHLHIQNGSLECGPIEPGWWSAQWAFEPIEGTSFVRIRNRWKSEMAIHNQNGYLEAGPIDLGWWSAQWALTRVGEEPENPYLLKSSGPPAATSVFTPQHNGTLGTAYVRYTDQIAIEGSVSVGTKVYFFPQHVATDLKLRPNFDPKNPPICGQTYTIIQVSPSIKLDREMPHMRNDENHHFKFVVELF